MEVTYKISDMIILLLLTSIFFAGCDKGSSSFNLEKTNSNNKQECIEPNNPYNDGGGHDAGFNWAAENGGDCNGNSDSFNEGCAEYHRQLSQYNECTAHNRK